MHSQPQNNPCSHGLSSAHIINKCLVEKVTNQANVTQECDPCVPVNQQPDMFEFITKQIKTWKQKLIFSKRKVRHYKYSAGLKNCLDTCLKHRTRPTWIFPVSICDSQEVQQTEAIIGGSQPSVGGLHLWSGHIQQSALSINPNRVDFTRKLESSQKFIF